MKITLSFSRTLCSIEILIKKEDYFSFPYIFVLLYIFVFTFNAVGTFAFSINGAHWSYLVRFVGRFF